MKHTFILLCSLLFSTLVLVAFSNHDRVIAHGFVNEPQDSIVFEIKDYVLPASEITIWNVIKCDGYLYFCFHEQSRSDFNASHNFLMAASEDNLLAKYVPLPDNADDFSSISVINEDIMVIELEDERRFCLDSKKWEWYPYKSRIDDGTIYNDDDWEVKHAYHGEFGEVTWFIDKHSKEEYAFVGLTGSIRRIDNTLYVVNETRIYKISDPSIGFRCNSSTKYKKAKESRLISLHFHRAGYSPLNHTFSPIVHFDNENPEIEIHEEEEYTWYDGGFYVSDFAKADTVIVGSFVSSNTLFCALNTPSGLELVQLDGDALTTVHSFNKEVGVSHFRYRLPDKYPSIASTFKYHERITSPDEKLLLLLNIEPGASEFIDIANDGNNIVKLRYEHSGLQPVVKDGFSELLSFYLNNWGELTLDRVIQEEKHFGGEVSYLNLGSNRNSFPPKEIFSTNERYHIDIVSKVIGDSFKVDSEYWVQESDKSIPAIYMNWSRLRYGTAFDPKTKYEELVGIVTASIGPGTLYPATNGKMKYTEWHSGQRIIKLYGDSYDVRFIMY